MATVEDRVASGAYMLDVHYGPDWRNKIDLDTLDLKHCETCILGQVFGTYEDGLEKLGIWDKWGMVQSDMLGFTIDLNGADQDIQPEDNESYLLGLVTVAFDRLQMAWRDLLVVA